MASAWPTKEIAKNIMISRSLLVKLALQDVRNRGYYDRHPIERSNTSINKQKADVRI
jgi:hypothetical protein